MRPSLLVAFTAPLLTTAAPTTTNPGTSGYFNVTNFSYKCPSSNSKAPCTWNFDVTSGPSFEHHPAIKEPLHCTGNTTEKEFTPGSCTDPKSSKYLHINGYVGTTKKAGTRLYLQYVKVPKSSNGFFWFFMGNATVTDAASQPKAFQVDISSEAGSS